MQMKSRLFLKGLDRKVRWLRRARSKLNVRDGIRSSRWEFDVWNGIRSSRSNSMFDIELRCARSNMCK